MVKGRISANQGGLQAPNAMCRAPFAHWSIEMSGMDAVSGLPVLGYTIGQARVRSTAAHRGLET
jgi:hypothetical protein